MTAVAVLLALAVLAGAGPSTARTRAGRSRPERPPPRRPAPGTDVVALAADLEVFALCLSAGMPVSVAATATARHAAPELAAVLSRGADLLALGAEPEIAWSAPNDEPADSGHSTAAAVRRLARRSGSSGTALSAGLTELAAQCRDDAAQAATAAAERAGVLIAGPLGLCFLPAFVCLGVVPVVAGLAGDVLGSGLL